ncbi:cytochrome P450 [Mycena leptocephala]|nr:cytochrome P450 [Mycena leptocephala]
MASVCAAVLQSVENSCTAAFGCTLEEMGDELITQHRHAINLRRYTIVTRKLGERLVSGKLEASRRGLEMDNDVYSSLLHPDALQEEKDAMTASEVAAKTAMFLIAGHETTVQYHHFLLRNINLNYSRQIRLHFGLHELAKNTDFQEELRAEIYSAIGGDIAYDSMPLLNAFIKETLRMHPVTPLTEHIATEDTVLPLSHAITTASGERISEIPIRQGQIIMMAHASYQRHESLWGSDAGEFKPSRWTDGTTYKGDALGPYANLLSSLGGPRTCLGWRFAILEMQAVIFVLGREVFIHAAGGRFRAALLGRDTHACHGQWRQRVSPACFLSVVEDE